MVAPVGRLLRRLLDRFDLCLRCLRSRYRLKRTARPTRLLAPTTGRCQPRDLSSLLHLCGLGHPNRRTCLTPCVREFLDGCRIPRHVGGILANLRGGSLDRCVQLLDSLLCGGYRSGIRLKDYPVERVSQRSVPLLATSPGLPSL